jgi:hypothetical protein
VQRSTDLRQRGRVSIEADVSISIGPSVAARLVESLLAAQRDVSRPLEAGMREVLPADQRRLTTTIEDVVGTIYTDLIYPQLVTYPELEPDGTERHDDAPARPANGVPPSKKQVGLEMTRACQRVSVRLDELAKLVAEAEGDASQQWFRRSAMDVRAQLKDLASLAAEWAGE